MLSGPPRQHHLWLFGTSADTWAAARALDANPWYFDVMRNRKRWRMPVDEFAIARGATAPITWKEAAAKVWGRSSSRKSSLDATPGFLPMSHDPRTETATPGPALVIPAPGGSVRVRPDPSIACIPANLSIEQWTCIDGKLTWTGAK